ncbi:MAG: hypothetical protein ACI8Q1_001629 [Parvicella sp.]|jgi:hypothetical protein
MKWFLILILFTSYSAFGQDSIPFIEVNHFEEEEDSSAQPFTGTLIEPTAEFPGGQDSLYKFIGDHFTIPQDLDSLDYSMSPGKVYIQFTIDTTGAVTNVNVPRGMTAKLNQAAIDVIEMMPDWDVDYWGREPMPFTFALPIRIELPVKYTEIIKK